jgi:hypothetical protein
VYNIKGNDKLGEYDILRRYNEFFALREVLLQRWPGIYIPPIPVFITDDQTRKKH